MKIKYLGPRDQIFVGSYGQHWKDEVKEYPEDVGKEILATMKQNRFEMVGKGDEEPDDDSLESKTVAELTGMLEEKGSEIPPKARKADLIALLKAIDMDREPPTAEE